MTRVPQTDFPQDRFDDVDEDPARLGAHRAPRPRFRWVVVLLWWLLAVAVLTGAGILAFLALSSTESISLPSSSQTAVATPSPSEIDTSYTVLVLNGTADAEASAAVQEAVRDAGWDESDIVPLNSDVNDFQHTTVYYADAEDQAAAQGLADALEIDAVQENDEFAAMSDGGLTIVVGLDRVSES
nr:LytR C-terminal domain-containing protein [Microbacterium excoecariae]